jgi:hypothetical protein
MNDGKKLNTRASGVIAAAVMLSRLLGLVREVLFNALFGTAAMGLFLIAFRLPNLLRDLFAEGALSTAFITVFSQKLEKEGSASAWALASKMLTLATIFMSAVSLLGIIFAEPLVNLLAPGFDPQDAAFTILLTRIMYPFILMVSLAALVMGILNSRQIFTAPALASSFFNIGSIAGGVLFGWIIDPSFGPKALTGLAIGTLIGGFLQFAMQLPSLHRAGFRFRPDFRWNDSGIKRTLILNSLFYLGEYGNYRIKAMIYAAELGKYFASKAGGIEISEGMTVWQQTVGVPEGQPNAGANHTISVIKFDAMERPHYYVRIEDKQAGSVFCAHKMGTAIEGQPPQMQLDFGNNLYVLQTTGPRHYQLSKISINGELESQTEYDAPKARPYLRRLTDGRLQIVGAVRSSVVAAARDQTPKLSERPPGLPQK